MTEIFTSPCPVGDLLEVLRRVQFAGLVDQQEIDNGRAAKRRQLARFLQHPSTEDAPMAEASRMRIISDGCANNTFVLDARGDRLKTGATGIVKIEIFPIKPNDIVRAVITVEDIGLDVDADVTQVP